MLSKIVAVIAVGGSTLSCGSACPREGCDALARRVSDSGGMSRVAGVLASETDVVENGCQKCGFASGTVSAWPRQGGEVTAAAVREQTSSAELASAMAGSDGKYVLALEAGSYWICAGISCFAASVVPGRTTTLNVRMVNGPSSGFLALPDAQGVTEVAAVERAPM